MFLKKINERLKGETFVSTWYKFLLRFKASDFILPKESGTLSLTKSDYGIYLSKFSVADSINLFNANPDNFILQELTLIKEESPELLVFMSDYVETKIPNDFEAKFWFNLGATYVSRRGSPAYLDTL